MYANISARKEINKDLMFLYRNVNKLNDFNRIHRASMIILKKAIKRSHRNTGSVKMATKYLDIFNEEKFVRTPNPTVPKFAKIKIFKKGELEVLIDIVEKINNLQDYLIPSEKKIMGYIYASIFEVYLKTYEENPNIFLEDDL